MTIMIRSLRPTRRAGSKGDGAASRKADTAQMTSGARLESCRRRLRLVRAIPLALVMAGVVGLVSAGAATATTIVGGSAAERAVLRQIVAALGTTRIPELRIVPVDGGVKRRTHVRASRPSWDTLVVAGSFLERSAELGLPPLVEVDAGQAGWPISNAGSTEPPPATA